ncbi:esterase/lipase family protein [Amycolatopsis japonica]
MTQSDVAKPFGGVSGSGLLPWLVAAARLPFRHEAQAFAQRRAIEAHPLWSSPSDNGGLPVLLVGGMGSSPALMAPMQGLFERLGCRVAVAPVRFGIGCGEETARSVEDALRDLVETAAAPAVVIAHSRGGQFARAVAVRRPELVRGLVTLGSPLTRMLAVHPLLLAHVTVLGAAGAAGVPGLLRPGCRWGTCCARLRADLTGPFPATVPFLSVYSRTDRIVDWHSSCDPAARHHEVVTSHGGLIWDPASLTVIAEELAALAVPSAAGARSAPRHRPLAA